VRRVTLGIMENKNATDQRIRARDSATKMLNRLTAGLAFGAIAGVAVLGAVSAYTIPGATSTSSSGATASTGTSSGTTSTGTGSALQASPTPVSSSSGSGVAVSGGS
jgi:hypothetical protein